MGSVVESKYLRSLWLAKAITVSTSIGVHDAGGDITGVGGPMEVEETTGVGGGRWEVTCTMASDSGSSSSSLERADSSSLGGTSRIPDVDGRPRGGSIGSVNVNFDEAVGCHLAGGLGGGQWMKELGPRTSSS